MQLTVLGTATPYPQPGNACSGYLLRGGGTTLWIDAGTGTLAELQRHVALVDVDAIFISHRHADHSADLLVAYYALRFSSLRPQRRIRVLGPEALADRLADFLGPDALQGLHEVFEFTELSGWGDTTVGSLGLAWGPVSHGVPAFALTVTGAAEIAAAGAASAETTLAGAAATAVAGAVAAVAASAESPSTAALLAQAAPAAVAALVAPAAVARTSSFTYSGDTAPCISLVEMAEESGVLLCEVGYAREALGEPAVHHTPEDAGRTAAAAGVGTIILTHLADDLPPSEALRRTRAHFSGDIVLASPGETYPA